MKILSRMAATAAGAVAISVLAIPAAGAATTTASSHYGGGGKIRVCVQGLRGGEAEVSVAGRSVDLGGGDCATFRGLQRGQVYRVSAEADRGCRIFNEERYVRAAGSYPRTVVFYGRCWGGGGWHDDDGDGDGRPGGWNGQPGGWNGQPGGSGGRPGDGDGGGHGPR